MDTELSLSVFRWIVFLYVCTFLSLELLDFYIKTILSVTSYRL